MGNLKLTSYLAVDQLRVGSYRLSLCMGSTLAHISTDIPQMAESAVLTRAGMLKTGRFGCYYASYTLSYYFSVLCSRTSLQRRQDMYTLRLIYPFIPFHLE